VNGERDVLIARHDRQIVPDFTVHQSRGLSHTKASVCRRGIWEVNHDHEPMFSTDLPRRQSLLLLAFRFNGEPRQPTFTLRQCSAADHQQQRGHDREDALHASVSLA